MSGEGWTPNPEGADDSPEGGPPVSSLEAGPPVRAAGSASPRLVLSPNFRAVPHRGGFLCYHTLFGNPRHLSPDALQLARRFQQPRDTGPTAEAAGAGAAALAAGLESLSYLVPPDADERAAVRQWLERRERLVPTGYLISEVELSVSDLCNFNCSYCFADTADEISPDRKRIAQGKERLMPLERARRAVENLLQVARKAGRRRLWVKFVGREPLLNIPVMLQVMEHFGSGEGWGLEVKYDITTNCSLITPDLAEEFARHGATVNASLDVLGEASDRTRTDRRGRKTFEIVDRAIKLLRQHGVDVIINSVLTHTNFDQLDERLVDYAADHQAVRLHLVPVMACDDLAVHARYPAPEIVDRLGRLWEYGRTRGLRVRGYWHNGVSRLLAGRTRPFLERVDERNSCVATGNQINVEPTGDIFACRMSGVRLGHVDDLEGMLRSPGYRHYLMRCFSPACEGCDIEGFCHGLCVGHLEGKYNDIYRTDPPYCEVFRGMTRRVLEKL